MRKVTQFVRACSHSCTGETVRPSRMPAEGNGGGEDDACQCRMKSRAEDAVPEDDAKHEVGDRTDVTDSVDVEKESRDRRCAKKVHPRKFLRVEESNDDDGHEIIHDGQSRQKDFHGYGTREPRTETMPIANAMSVAVGMAQPERYSG